MKNPENNQATTTTTSKHTESKQTNRGLNWEEIEERVDLMQRSTNPPEAPGKIKHPYDINTALEDLTVNSHHPLSF